MDAAVKRQHAPIGQADRSGQTPLVERIVAFWVAVWCRASRVFPRPLTRFFGHCVGIVCLLACVRSRRYYMRNIQIIQGRRRNPIYLWFMAWKAFDHISTALSDFFHYSFHPRADVESVRGGEEGGDYVRALAAEGRGAMVVTAHLGAWELGALLLRGVLPESVTVHVVFFRDELESFERARTRARILGGVSQLPIGTSALSSLPVFHALRRGDFVALQGDRCYTPGTMAIPFFGHPAHFSTGPVRLAAGAKVPLLPGFVLHGPQGRYLVKILPPIEMVQRDDKEAELRENLTKWVRVLEEVIRDNLDQWYGFVKIWPDETPLARPEPAGPAPAHDAQG